MNRILFATELSVRTDRALKRASLLTAEQNAELHIIHVVEEDLHVYPGDARRDIEKAEKKIENDLSGKMHPDTIPQRYQVVVGDPKEEIIRAAEALKADLIVMGLSEETLVTNFLLGTTVERVIAEFNHPVLVVRNRPKQPYEHALIALDQTAPSRQALISALKMAPNAKISIVHAIEKAQPTRDEIAHAEDIITGISRGCVTDLPTDPNTGNKKFDVFVKAGKAADVILNMVASLEPDFVSFARSNKSEMKALFLGSTAKILIEHLECDLLVTPTANS